MADPKPLVSESSTSESIPVIAAVQEMEEKLLKIPDYQRDADQWDDTMKSLLIESIINNLSIPAFFFEPIINDSGVEYNEVIDGQQRLTTIFQYWKDGFALVSSENAPYLTPNSIHYANKKFSELPDPYRQAFRRYRLTVIKLRNLGDMRLETFRRINQGGTPLSGQDIRLAYYGDSRSVAALRIAGLYDYSSPAAERMLDDARKNHNFEGRWWKGAELETWSDWWMDKKLANGQTPSEMFLWSLVASRHREFAQLTENDSAVKSLKVQFNNSIDSALDAFCAQLKYQEKNGNDHQLLPTFEEITDRFLPFFQKWFHLIAGVHGSNLDVRKYRYVASAIGVSYRRANAYSDIFAIRIVSSRLIAKNRGHLNVAKR